MKRIALVATVLVAALAAFAITALAQSDLAPAADEVELDKSVSPTGPVYGGDTLTYTITLKNVSEEVTATAVLTDALPMYTDYVSHTIGEVVVVGDGTGGGTGTWSATQLTWNGTLPPSSVVTLTLTVKVSDGTRPGTVIVNEAEAVYEVPDVAPKKLTDAVESTVWGRIFLPIIMRNFTP